MAIRQQGDYQFESTYEGGAMRAHAKDPSTGKIVGTLFGTRASAHPHEALGEDEDPMDTFVGGAYDNISVPGQRQGELFNYTPGSADMLAVHPDHQGQGLARGLVNVVARRMGAVTPSDTLSPDSAGMLGHMGIDHAAPSFFNDDESSVPGAMKDRRDSWAKDSLDVRNMSMRGDLGGREAETARPELPLPPSFLAGTAAPASRPARSAPQKETLF